ncbi:MAG TPA: hypothetical protein GX507_11575 [Clostridia bacterium]|nr:hypothetical protein [Clostridia bacterium]
MNKENEKSLARLKELFAELGSDTVVDYDPPWRKHRSPYRVFLAEMLLVRTRADAVARRFEDVISKYPDIVSLATADVDEVASVIRPLGLTKRASYLVRAARFILENYKGIIPERIEDLVRIPGVGPYTASAIAAFAFGRALVPADVNVLRFLSRVTGLKMEHATKGSRELRKLALLLSESELRIPSERLLDFTRLICRPRRPACDRCALSKYCSHYLGKHGGLGVECDEPHKRVPHDD